MIGPFVEGTDHNALEFSEIQWHVLYLLGKRLIGVHNSNASQLVTGGRCSFQMVNAQSHWLSHKSSCRICRSQTACAKLRDGNAGASSARPIWNRPSSRWTTSGTTGGGAIRSMILRRGKRTRRTALMTTP